MNNSFFILSKQKIEIERFHICSWDIENEKSFVEIGFEFKFSSDIEKADFNFVAPFVNKQNDVRCLCQDLVKDSNNSKFIFNDNIVNSSDLNGDKRNGVKLEFETRGTLIVLPIQDHSKEKKQIVSFSVYNPKMDDIPCYIRFLIKSIKQSLSTEKRGITQTSFIYDIKLNEKRNLPDKVYVLTKDNYQMCCVNSCFCFHVIPNSFAISFIDQNKLKNIRELEVSAFKQYLPELEKLKEGNYFISFNKDKKQESYSFFSIFTREKIGTKQLFFAVGANIICSLLFAISSLRENIILDKSFFTQVPFEYWIATFVLTLAFVSFLPIKRIISFFTNIFHK